MDRYYIALCTLIAFSACAHPIVDPNFCAQCETVAWTPSCETECGLAKPKGCTKDECFVDTATGGVAENTGGASKTGGQDKTGGMQSGGMLASGGMAASGGNSTDTTTGGTSNNTGGTGGDSTPLPCNGSCTGDMPVCDEANDICVPCTDSDNGACGDQVCFENACVDCNDNTTCDSPTPVCDTTLHQCFECTQDTDCGSEFCIAHACVPCRNSDDCNDPSAAHCSDSHECVGCVGNDDCALIANKTVCNAEDQTCVQCTGTDYASCEQDVNGKQYVCNSLEHTCTNKVEHSAGSCSSCVTDAQCSSGQLCVMQTFGSPAESVGYFCFDAIPGDQTCNVRPYISPTANAVSIDGTMSKICDLRASTCPAANDYGVPCGDDDGNGNATTSGTPRPELCGFAHGSEDFGTGDNVDAYCVDSDPSVAVVLVCSPVCLGATDGSNSQDCQGIASCALIDGYGVCDPSP